MQNVSEDIDLGEGDSFPATHSMDLKGKSLKKYMSNQIAFLTTYFNTGDPVKAARTGNMVGGFVASEHGAIPIYPAEFIRRIDILSGAFDAIG